MTSGRITVIVAAAALVAIAAVIASSVDFGGDDDSGSGSPAAQETPDPRPQTPETSAEEPAAPSLPENPDDVHGSDDFALTRPANFRRALGVLERERQNVEGVFDGLRLAPGRIDTTIIHPDDRMTNLQVRADFDISSKFTHDFPTQADFRKGGLSARDVDTTAPARLLRQFDKQRSGSATDDVDYCVIDKDIIDFKVNISCYMRIRTPRPRSFLKEAGEPLRVIG
jgi:hypothetical protein